MFFVKEHSSDVLKQHGFKSTAEATKLLGEQWKLMTPDQKQPYLEMHIADKDRRDGQVKEYEEKGYFTRTDGTKSFEPKIYKQVKKKSYYVKKCDRQ